MNVSARLSQLRDVASDAVRSGTRRAAPVVSSAAAKLRARLQREPQPVHPPTPAGTTQPTPSAPAIAPGPPRQPGGPTPAQVARNIAPHPSAPAPAEPRPAVPRAAPGDKLPPRRRPDAG